jgi:hypothetical protein
LKKTGEIFNVKFEKNKLPISISLFNEASDNVGFKKGKYGKNQKNDLLAQLLRTEE